MADLAQLEAHRPALLGHCYRMLGSPFDAEDAVQDTLLRAWRARDSFDERASLRTWLYRIATNVCLDALGSRARRGRPVDLGPPGAADDPLNPRPAGEWLEPIADRLALPDAADPAERLMLRQSIRLAFVAALQYLPPKQRAALLLTEVLGWSAAEVAECLALTVASVNSALQRARATLASRRGLTPEPPSPDHAPLIERYVDAFERYDIDSLVTLLHDEATISMPPFALWFRGPAGIGSWLRGERASGCIGSRLLPAAANGSPAFGQYHPQPDGSYKPWSLIVLEFAGGRIAAINHFLDTAAVFPPCGLPLHIAAGEKIFPPRR